MAHESFEDQEIADILNQYFVPVKVDKEERPDIDSVYMRVCQTFTGSGGWPTTVFLTPEQKPFFAGTYFPKTSRLGSIGLKELLTSVHDKWTHDRASLLESASEITNLLSSVQSAKSISEEHLLSRAIGMYKQSFDARYGGFGGAPKFPAPHNLLFLMQEHEKHGDKTALEISEKTLRQMYRGGLFDHIGYGFSRYSTDKYFLAPHFEKMLYDNALLMLAYGKAYSITHDSFYLAVAEKTAAYILREMRSPQGGFYSAQDADSEGTEGKFYLFTPDEIIALLGNDTGEKFCQYYNITKNGNFEGKSIPNLLSSDDSLTAFDEFLPAIREYRKRRAQLHKDDKIITVWNSLMIVALCSLYRISRKSEYLHAAKDADRFIQNELFEDDALFVSFREEKRSGKAFVDDYAAYIFALLALFNATLEPSFLDRAQRLTAKAIQDFFDMDKSGFFLSGSENEQLILHPKESYDGAIPSGNSLMAYNLTRLNLMVQDAKTEQTLKKQMSFMSNEASAYPAGYAMFLFALSDYLEPPALVTVVPGSGTYDDLPFLFPLDCVVKILESPSKEFPLLNGETTFYICAGHACRPPVNKVKLGEIFNSDR